MIKFRGKIPIFHVFLSYVVRGFECMCRWNTGVSYTFPRELFKSHKLVPSRFIPSRSISAILSANRPSVVTSSFIRTRWTSKWELHLARSLRSSRGTSRYDKPKIFPFPGGLRGLDCYMLEHNRMVLHPKKRNPYGNIMLEFSRNPGV